MSYVDDELAEHRAAVANGAHECAPDCPTEPTANRLREPILNAAGGRDTVKVALMADTPRDQPISAKRLALALHAVDAGPLSLDIGCYSCATWPSENDPGFQPRPDDRCWQLAAALIEWMARDG